MSTVSGVLDRTDFSEVMFYFWRCFLDSFVSCIHELLLNLFRPSGRVRYFQLNVGVLNPRFVDVLLQNTFLVLYHLFRVKQFT